VTGVERFESFVRAHQDMVYGLACRLLGRAADAEDVAQTVFLRAFERFGQIGDSPSAAAWLRTVTRNECLNHLTRYRRRWRFFSELGHAGDRGAGSGDEEPFEARLPAIALPGLEAAERAAQLEAALAKLPDAQRVPLVLFHFEDMSYQDIADLLGVTLAKLKTDIHRGREALRNHLAGEYGPR
jgi:RNA polymerase sigma-70 factor (ECF subfamily)